MSKTKPVCINCNATESLLWRLAEKGEICNDCHINKEIKKELVEKQQDVEDSNASETKKDDESQALAKGTRKSTRSTRYKTKTPKESNKPGPPKGRGRRSLFKRAPIKAPTATATIVSSDNIYYKGFYLQVGDIVSMQDEDGDLYYAQIKGFLTDEYCEKSAAITWLLPTKASPPPNQAFDPATYIIGPEEDLPRKLDCMEFVMHAPSDYYKNSTSPYPPVETDVVSKNYSGFVWTSMDIKLR